MRKKLDKGTGLLSPRPSMRGLHKTKARRPSGPDGASPSPGRRERPLSLVMSPLETKDLKKHKSPMNAASKLIKKQEAARAKADKSAEKAKRVAKRTGKLQGRTLFQSNLQANDTQEAASDSVSFEEHKSEESDDKCPSNLTSYKSQLPSATMSSPSISRKTHVVGPAPAQFAIPAPAQFSVQAAPTQFVVPMQIPLAPPLRAPTPIASLANTVLCNQPLGNAASLPIPAHVISHVSSPTPNSQPSTPLSSSPSHRALDPYLFESHPVQFTIVQHSRPDSPPVGKTLQQHPSGIPVSPTRSTPRFSLPGFNVPEQFQPNPASPGGSSHAHLYVPDIAPEYSTPPPPASSKTVANLKRLAKMLKGQDLIDFMDLVGMEQLTSPIVAQHLADVHSNHVETIGSSKGAKEKKDEDKARRRVEKAAKKSLKKKRKSKNSEKVRKGKEVVEVDSDSEEDEAPRRKRGPGIEIREPCATNPVCTTHQTKKKTPKEKSKPCVVISTQSMPLMPKLSSGATSPPTFASWDTWGEVKDIPPFQVDSCGMPTGAFWNHMKNYAYDRAMMTFPWHVDWHKQSKELRAKFLIRLREVYPHRWVEKPVEQAIGNNLRERRNRLVTKFKIYGNKESVIQPFGCTKESFDAIWKSTQKGPKKAKADKCREAAEARFKEQPYTHRCGQGGYQGIIDRFTKEFGRPPTEFEIEYAKHNAYKGLVAHTYKKLGTGKLENGPKFAGGTDTSEEENQEVNNAESSSGTSGSSDEDSSSSDSEEE